MTRTRHKRWPAALISLSLTLALCVPVAYVMSPWVYQQVMIHRFTSNDLTKRQRSLSYAVAHLPEDKDLRRDVINTLSVEDDKNFLQIVDALQAAGCWDESSIPADPWLRWIDFLAKEPGVEAPILAAQRLADLQRLTDDPRLLDLLKSLSEHEQPDVRYNAMCALVELYQSAKDKAPYQTLIASLLNDPNQQVAYHATIFACLMHLPGIDAFPWLDDAWRAPTDLQYNLPQIQSLLASPDVAVRDVGCVLAVRDLDANEVSQLIKAMLADKNDQVRTTGAILAGISGQHLDLLTEKLKEQTDWVVASTMKLGLWMNADASATDLQPEVLLAQGDVPRTTIILAMLHRDILRALDVLLNPRGEAPQDLARLLEDYGWWRVLDYYLPEDAPCWQSTNDPAMQQQQVDLLCDWYLLNRFSLKQTAQSSD